MNVINKTLTILSLCAYACTTYAAPDCMDNSWQLTKKADFKELHYVSCNHDCYKDPHARLVVNRGKCSICGHFHKPRPLVMVKTVDPAALPAQKTAPKKAKNQLARLFTLKQKK